MKEESESAASWWAQQLNKLSSSSSSNPPPTLPNEIVQSFQKSLAHLLRQKYQGHWYPENPLRGNAFRSIFLLPPLGKLDNLLVQAAHLAGVPDLLERIPQCQELTMWVDPGSVIVKFAPSDREVKVYSGTPAVQPLTSTESLGFKKEILHRPASGSVKKPSSPSKSGSPPRVANGPAAPVGTTSSGFIPVAGGGTSSKTTSPRTSTDQTGFRVNSPAFTPKPLAHSDPVLTLHNTTTTASTSTSTSTFSTSPSKTNRPSPWAAQPPTLIKSPASPPPSFPSLSSPTLKIASSSEPPLYNTPAHSSFDASSPAPHPNIWFNRGGTSVQY